jgi:CheY-like chemotaxis protein
LRGKFREEVDFPANRRQELDSMTRGRAHPSAANLTPQGSGLNCMGKKIIAAVHDLFFVIKINEAAKRAGVPVEFVKDDRSLLQQASEKPALIIIDLNCMGVKPLQSISKLKANPDLRDISLLGYVSHVNGELKQKAQDLGCDMVLARSAFSQNLQSLLKRHSAR